MTNWTLKRLVVQPDCSISFKASRCLAAARPSSGSKGVAYNVSKSTPCQGGSRVAGVTLYMIMFLLEGMTISSQRGSLTSSKGYSSHTAMRVIGGVTVTWIEVSVVKGRSSAALIVN